MDLQYVEGAMRTQYNHVRGRQNLDNLKSFRTHLLYM